ncbi:MAG: glycerol kinase GlpK [Alphaproteobacteria bacterium]|jgi:glycerol kinase|nr:glycerol kinase GlpK [Alphaproteobacteria bacterium]MDP7223300.1 glycerol kinase GlpK [Alphaproteobacteria bacterium]
MSQKYILSIDQGTTSSRAMLFRQDSSVVDVRQKELTLHYPHKGWIEQDAEDIWADTLWACQALIKAQDPSLEQIAVIGITNQRETTIIWDRKTGKPVYNAIVWQDRRTADFCAGLKNKGHEDMVQEKTGLLLDPYFSGSKIAWILDNVEGVREKAEKGDLAFGTVDSFLLWRLTNGKAHVTDVTNASRTMLFNIQTQQWDDELLALFNIPKSLLPEVKDNIAEFGTTAPDLFGKPLTVGGVAGDQQAALIGQACFTKGMVKSTYGTGCFLLMNIGDTFKKSENRLLTTPAYRINGKTTYASEGAIFVAGAAIQWLRDGLGILKHAADSESMALQANPEHGVSFIPAFTGLGAPWWDPHAKAAIMGLTRENTANDVVRAALEAQAFQTQDLMSAIKADTGHDPAVIRADGGLVENNFMTQFLADILSKPVEIPKNAETTAQGAAYLAGLYAGLYDSFDDVSAAWQQDRNFDPVMDTKHRDAHLTQWSDSIQRVLN